MNFTTDTHLSDFNFQLACRKSISHYYPWTRPLGYAAAGLLLITYAGAIYLNNVSGSGDYNYLMYGGLAAIIAYLTHLVLRRRKIMSSLQNGALRNGTTTLVLNDEGYHSEKPGCRMFISWGHFDDVIETKEGLILLNGLSEFQVIPSSAFSKGSIPSEVLEQIKACIASAKSADFGNYVS